MSTINDQVAQFLAISTQQGLNRQRLQYEAAETEARQRAALGLNAQQEGARVGQMLIADRLEREADQEDFGRKMRIGTVMQELKYHEENNALNNEALDRQALLDPSVKRGYTAKSEEERQSIQNDIDAVMASDRLDDEEKAYQVGLLNIKRARIRQTLVPKTEEEKAAAQKKIHVVEYVTADEQGNEIHLGYQGPKGEFIQPRKESVDAAAETEEKLLKQATDAYGKIWQGVPDAMKMDTEHPEAANAVLDFGLNGLLEFQKKFLRVHQQGGATESPQPPDYSKSNLERMMTGGQTFDEAIGESESAARPVMRMPTDPAQLRQGVIYEGYNSLGQKQRFRFLGMDENGKPKLEPI